MFEVDLTEPEGCQGANHRPGEHMDGATHRRDLQRWLNEFLN